MTLFNYWHYIFLGISFLIFFGGLISAFRQENKKLIFPMIVAMTLISILVASFSMIMVDKYTKKVELFKLKNKRLLSTEQIVYSGTVKNTGDFEIGKVTLEIKLVNKGRATGNVKGGNFYKPSGFADFFGSGMKIIGPKPQTLVKEFVVAENLNPGHAKHFRVHFRYPGHFRNVAQFTKVEGK